MTETQAIRARAKLWNAWTRYRATAEARDYAIMRLRAHRLSILARSVLASV